VDAQSGVLSVDMPGTSTSTTPGTALTTAAQAEGAGQLLGTTSLPGAMVASYATAQGLQALIAIKDSSAAQCYEFRLVLPAGATPSVQPDGSVTILDATGVNLGHFDSPWARDADDMPVATRYRLEGTTLVQTVEHAPGSAYPSSLTPAAFGAGLFV